jgi:hypothetical protein
VKVRHEVKKVYAAALGDESAIGVIAVALYPGLQRYKVPRRPPNRLWDNDGYAPPSNAWPDWS